MCAYIRAGALQPKRNAKEQRHYNAVHTVQNQIVLGHQQKSKHQGSKPLRVLLSHMKAFYNPPKIASLEE